MSKKLPTTTTLQHVQEFNSEDFCIPVMEYSRLLNAQVNGDHVTVDCLACEGYYDITLPDGTEYMAIAGHHLVGFDQDRP